MKWVLTNKYMSIHTRRRRSVECYIAPIVMYRCKIRTISIRLKKIEAKEMWRMLRFSCTAKNSNETATIKSLIKLIEKVNAINLFRTCNDKRETGTIFDNQNDRKKMQQRKTARKYVGWINKVAKCGASDRCS